MSIDLELDPSVVPAELKEHCGGIEALRMRITLLLEAAQATPGWRVQPKGLLVTRGLLLGNLLSVWTRDWATSFVVVLDSPIGTKVTGFVTAQLGDPGRGPLSIDLVTRDDGRAIGMVERVEPLSRWALFRGERWSPVEVVAVVRGDDGDDVGLATLAPHDEDGEPHPTMFGLWVDPAARRRRIATALLLSLAAESHRRYGAAAHVQAVTADGQLAIAAARAEGADLIAEDTAATGLPWLP